MLATSCERINNDHPPQLENTNINSSKDIDKINIYCWCFHLFPSILEKQDGSIILKDYLGNETSESGICLTPSNLKKEDLLKSAFFKGEISDDLELKIFKDSLINTNLNRTKMDFGSDPRLIFQIENKDQTTDYLFYYSENKLLYNDSILIEYPYRIDSLIFRHFKKFNFICE